MTVLETLRDHLIFFGELGISGISKDDRWRVIPAWRFRAADVGTPLRVGDRLPPNSQTGSVWLPLSHEASAFAEATADHTTLRVVDPPNTIEGLSEIREDLGECTRCKLHGLGRRQIVFGVGSPTAELMFVGEAPGYDEDLQGEPFVGRAGQLLTKIIESIGLAREQVYIANVIKCRPPDNRNPDPDEIQSCQPFLFRQIDAIRPKVLVALGTFAARTLLQTQDPISRLRGRVYEYRGAKLIPTFHPAFLLRTPNRKRDVWEDMKRVRSLLIDTE